MSIQALSTLTSGLAAQSARVARTADNIANVTTPGYRPQTSQMVAVPGGVREVGGDGTGEVDLGREVVSLVLAKTAYGAAAKTFAGVARMDSAVLDILA